MRQEPRYVGKQRKLIGWREGLFRICADCGGDLGEDHRSRLDLTMRLFEPLENTE